MLLKFNQKLTNKNKSKTFFIIAGEESADNHGAALINAIHTLNPEINFIGIGGEKMIKAGLKSMEDIKKLAIMGFIEILLHLYDLFYTVCITPK